MIIAGKQVIIKDTNNNIKGIDIKNKNTDNDKRHTDPTNTFNDIEKLIIFKRYFYKILKMNVFKLFFGFNYFIIY